MSMENHDGMMQQKKLLICPPELSGNPTSRVSWQQAGVTGEGNNEFGLANNFLNAIKSYDMRPPALLPLRRKACCGCLLPL
jgi:hypothetical protein